MSVAVVLAVGILIERIGKSLTSWRLRDFDINDPEEALVASDIFP
jgi:hypothetical protein